MNAGARFGSYMRLQRSVNEHHESVEGLVIESHDKGIQGGRAPCSGGEPGKEGRAIDGGGLAGGGGGAGRGEEVGEAEGGTSGRTKDVSAEVLVVDAKYCGCALGCRWIEEAVTASNRTWRGGGMGRERLYIIILILLP